MNFADQYSESYESILRLSDFANSLSVKNQGKLDPSHREEYSSWIFAKICTLMMSVIKLAPSGLTPKQEGETEVWDISSICALTRTVIDAYYSMFYIATEHIPTEESNFRKCLWGFYSERHRLNLLRQIGSRSPDMKALEKETTALSNKLLADPVYLSLDSRKQRDARKGNLAIHLSNTELSTRAGISSVFYKTAYRFLSDYTHCYAFSVNQLMAFRAGNPESLGVISVVINYCTAFLSLAIRDFLTIFPEERIPQEISLLISKWEEISSNFGSVVGVGGSNVG